MGYLAGFPLLDINVVLHDGAFHDVDSSVMAFEIAGRAAFREAAQSAAPKLLEPIMDVEVVTPEEYMGDGIGDLNSSRGQIAGTESRSNATVIKSKVPLANMFGYVSHLRSMIEIMLNLRCNLIIMSKFRRLFQIKLSQSMLEKDRKIMQGQNIRIRLKAYDHRLLDTSTTGNCKYSKKNGSKCTWSDTFASSY